MLWCSHVNSPSVGTDVEARVIAGVGYKSALDLRTQKYVRVCMRARVIVMQSGFYFCMRVCEPLSAGMGGDVGGGELHPSHRKCDVALKRSRGA